jgi:hypothetical protein
VSVIENDGNKDIKRMNLERVGYQGSMDIFWLAGATFRSRETNNESNNTPPLLPPLFEHREDLTRKPLCEQAMEESWDLVP